MVRGKDAEQSHAIDGRSVSLYVHNIEIKFRVSWLDMAPLKYE
jgi:hypothetical protein